MRGGGGGRGEMFKKTKGKSPAADPNPHRQTRPDKQATHMGESSYIKGYHAASVLGQVHHCYGGGGRFRIGGGG